jgi:hypothetical protein
MSKIEPLSLIYSELSIQIFRILTGRLLTKKQIKDITEHAVGRYFKDLFPETAHLDRSEKIALAQENISTASNIIAELKLDLDAQVETLNQLIAEIKEKQDVALQYEELAKTNKDAARAVRAEIENSIRHELESQSNKNRKVRRISSIIIWLLTLILGGALGAYFKDIVGFVLSI